LEEYLERPILLGRIPVNTLHYLALHYLEVYSWRYLCCALLEILGNTYMCMPWKWSRAEG